MKNLFLIVLLTCIAVLPSGAYDVKDFRKDCLKEAKKLDKSMQKLADKSKKLKNEDFVELASDKVIPADSREALGLASQCSLEALCKVMIDVSFSSSVLKLVSGMTEDEVVKESVLNASRK